MQVPLEARRGHLILQNWSYRHFRAAHCGCWELNQGWAKEQYLLLINESSLQPISHFYMKDLSSDRSAKLNRKTLSQN